MFPNHPTLRVHNRPAGIQVKVTAAGHWEREGLVTRAQRAAASSALTRNWVSGEWCDRQFDVSPVTDRCSEAAASVWWGRTGQQSYSVPLIKGMLLCSAI